MGCDHPFKLKDVCRITSGLLPVQVGEDALATWQGTIAVQFSDVGFAPAAAMLSAYGYFNGTLPLNSTSNAPAAAAAGGEGGHKLIPASRRSLSSSSSSSGGGSPQAVQYSAFGAAVTEVELDLLTGERRVLATDIAYDCGYALNPRIDLGQVEGAFVMGELALACRSVYTGGHGLRNAAVQAAGSGRGWGCTLSLVR
jgi:CO/xanthine dehydrogenase Mo-binding subunit